jgi:hypothetical protein
VYKKLLVILTFLAVAGIADATVFFVVGTKDGLLACEDTRLTLTTVDPSVISIGPPLSLAVEYDDSYHKLFRLGQYGMASVAGNLSSKRTSSDTLAARV